MILAYQVEIAHTAIDAGADLVMGHGPHTPLGIEIYQDKPIFYGVGSSPSKPDTGLVRIPTGSA